MNTDGKSKTSGAFKRKLRKIRDEKINKLPKLDRFVLSKREPKTVPEEPHPSYSCSLQQCPEKSDVTVVELTGRKREEKIVGDMKPSKETERDKEQEVAEVENTGMNLSDPEPSCSSVQEYPDERDVSVVEITGGKKDEGKVIVDNVWLSKGTEQDNEQEVVELENADINNSEVNISTTDIGAFLNKHITNDLKQLIISLPSCQPKGPYPKDPLQNNRSFSSKYYVSKTKYGLVQRLWLCYSKILDAAYCEPCWLFSDGDSQWRTTGVRGWKNLSVQIKKHSGSKLHVQACKIYDLWKKNKVIDKEAEQIIRNETSFWKLVLDRLFNITLMLAKNSLAFRGHREKVTESGDYNGNFLCQVQLIAKYDHILKQVIDMPKGSTRYLSPTIQNEIIHVLAQNLESHLVSSIKNSPFFSLIMDTTQDISKKDQLSLVIRHANIERNEFGEPQNVEIRETFLGFYEVKDRSAQGITEFVLGILRSKGIDIKNCYGQGYDGASVMSGCYTGVQTKIKQLQPNAEYVHCASHTLNLVVNDAVNGCKDVRLFFTVLERIYTFFGLSINRWDLLSKFTNESEITLKRLNPTRWSGRLNSITAVKLRYMDILKALTEIILKSSKKDEREEASQIRVSMESFEFVFQCIMMHKILLEINYSSSVLQKKNFELSEAADALSRTLRHVKDLRSSYDSCKEEAVAFAQKLGIQTSFQAKRQPKVKQHYDELASDHRFQTSEMLFKVNVYCLTIDIVIQQIENRFESFHELNNVFGFMLPKNFLTMSENDIVEGCNKVQQKYSEIIGKQFPLQFVNAVNLVKDDVSEHMSLKDFTDMLLQRYSLLESDFSEVLTCLLLFLTLPVTTATAERSFSKLKIIKNYLRNSVGQDRLKDLSLLAIEHKAASTMDVKDSIERFANNKARRRRNINI